MERSALDQHQCDLERVLDFAMFRLREEVDAFEPRLQQYLETARGRFDSWLAARDVRRRAA